MLNPINIPGNTVSTNHFPGYDEITLLPLYIITSRQRKILCPTLNSLPKILSMNKSAEIIATPIRYKKIIKTLDVDRDALDIL